METKENNELHIVVDRTKRKILPIDMDVLENTSHLNSNDKIIYFLLCKHAMYNRGIFPSLETIGAKAGCSKPTVVSSIKKLKEIGMIEVETRRKPDGKQQKNIYYINEIPDVIRENPEKIKEPKKTQKTCSEQAQYIEKLIHVLEGFNKTTKGISYSLSLTVLEAIKKPESFKLVQRMNDLAKSNKNQLKALCIFLNKTHRVPKPEEWELICEMVEFSKQGKIVALAIQKLPKFSYILDVKDEFVKEIQQQMNKNEQRAMQHAMKNTTQSKPWNPRELEHFERL